MLVQAPTSWRFGAEAAQRHRIHVDAVDVRDGGVRGKMRGGTTRRLNRHPGVIGVEDRLAAAPARSAASGGAAVGELERARARSRSRTARRRLSTSRSPGRRRRSRASVTTCARSASRGEPGVAWATVLRLTQVWRRFAAAARFCCLGVLDVRGCPGDVAGPILRYVAPAEATSASASRPPGVVVPGSGPFASTIGNVFAPSRRTVPVPSLPVVAAAGAARARGGNDC